MSKKPLLLFPIEIKAREFSARLFLAGLAVKAGYTVMIGRSKPLHRTLFKFPRGILVENDATPRSAQFFKKAQKMGYKIVAWDEESLVTLTDAIYAQLRVCPETLDLIEYFFCRGEGDKKAVDHAYPGHSEKLIAAGNPRLDILQPQWTGEIEDNKNRPITLLINSRFSIVNPYYISREKAFENVFKKFGIARDSDTGQHIDGWLSHAHKMFIAFAELTEKIAKAYPHYRIIIRPHPSENHGFWGNLAAKYDNCECLYEGAASDWFLRADCLIHNSCTTAIEAGLSGLPSHVYLPAGDNLYDAALPNSVSHKHYDSESLISALANVQKLSQPIREDYSLRTRGALKEHISNVEKVGSSAVILNHIQKIDWQKSRASYYIWRLYDAFRTTLSHTKNRLIDAVKKGKKLQEARKGYANQKYPGVTEQEIENLLRKFGYDDFAIHESKHEWFVITPKQH